MYLKMISRFNLCLIVFCLLLINNWCGDAFGMVKVTYNGVEYKGTESLRNTIYAGLYNINHLEDGNFALREIGYGKSVCEGPSRTILFTLKNHKLEGLHVILSPQRDMFWTVEDLLSEDSLNFDANLVIPQFVYHFKDGKKHGLQKRYESGKLVHSQHFNSGVPNGEMKLFHENGNLWVKRMTDQKIRNCVVYHANGKIQAEGKYGMGGHNGPWTYYYKNGKIKAAGIFEEGNRTGEWKYYNDKGDLLSVAKFRIVQPNPNEYGPGPYEKLMNNVSNKVQNIIDTTGKLILYSPKLNYFVLNVVELTTKPKNQEKNNSQSKVESHEIEVGVTGSILDIDKTLKIKLIKVVEDSRCPKNAQCKWAGNAKLIFKITGKDRIPVKIELNTNQRFKQETKVAGYKLKLVGLSPLRDKGNVISLALYKALLEAEKVKQ